MLCIVHQMKHYKVITSNVTYLNIFTLCFLVMSPLPFAKEVTLTIHFFLSIDSQK